MADDKNKQDGRDDSRIDANDSSELNYAAEQFGVSIDRIREAIEKVGNSRDKVGEYLKSR
ncbi:MAG: DUF3606 domain-containing protein [Sphingobacteriales bacterium]|nr:MAG: DUF3606 domain-containing protein [Sphingobacteriales bacterium]